VIPESKSPAAVFAPQPAYPLSGERPTEHLRNARALLTVAQVDDHGGRVLSAAEYRAVQERLARAIELLEAQR
jgi:hypothetical protein